MTYDDAVQPILHSLGYFWLAACVSFWRLVEAAGIEPASRKGTNFSFCRNHYTPLLFLTGRLCQFLAFVPPFGRCIRIYPVAAAEPEKGLDGLAFVLGLDDGALQLRYCHFFSLPM